MKRLVLYLIMLSIPLAAAVGALGYFSYWSIPHSPATNQGDPIAVFDPEIGFVPRPNSVSRRHHSLLDGSELRYSLYTDRLGARVVSPGDQTPDTIDILFIGDSVTWGHGVEASDTFAMRVGRDLDVGIANVGMGSYGTTHALQMLRRHRGLKPKIVVYVWTPDQIHRNVLACARSTHPFCLELAYVGFEGGKPHIVTPRRDGLTRLATRARYERNGLPAPEWLTHGIDVAASLVFEARAQGIAAAADREAALAFLMREMVKTTTDIGAELLVVAVPAHVPLPPPPEVLTTGPYRYVDLTPAHDGRPELFIPSDGHPSVAGHAVIAAAITKMLREKPGALTLR